jgi:F0F1-type ATP synthase assembly protein I
MNEKKFINKFSDSYKEIGPYLGLGTQLAATIVVMFFFGRWLDEKFNTYPFLILLLSFLGGFAGIYNFIKAVLQLNKKNENDKKS